MYGKIDVVRRRFFVATQFFYVLYFPLIPLQTYLVYEENEDSFRGTALPFTLKFSLVSIMVAYLRAMIPLVAVILYFAATDKAPLFTPQNGPTIIVELILIAVWLVSYRLRKSNPQRILELKELAGLPEHPIPRNML